jgi:phosphonoacetaldehyde hydrolase
MPAPFQHLKAVVFDWAGTVIDYGSRAPMGVFLEVFRSFGVEISIEEARIPMGLPKLAHIEALGALPRVADGWRTAHGRDFSREDALTIYDVFVPINRRVVSDPQYATLIPGVAETARALREGGLKIGSTTGYTRDILSEILETAAAQGFAPDNTVCAGDLSAGRPSPLMMYKCFLDLAVWPASAVVKVDDTAPGIAEGRAAGTWTVGVAVSGNAFGLSEDETKALSRAEFATRRERAVLELEGAGADYVVDSVADLASVLKEIDLNLARDGRRPNSA